MNTHEIIKDNLNTASSAQAGDLTKQDEEMLQSVAKAINAGMKVGCTGCGYCMPCPKNVDIPGTFAAYNRRYAEGWFYSMKEYIMCTALRKNSTAASNCVDCGKCEKHCPQNIPIRQCLKDAKRELEGPVYRIARKVAKWFVHF